MPSPFTESVLESAALEWLAEIGYEIAFGPEIAPDGERPERGSYGEVVLAGRLRAAIGRLNSDIPEACREEAIKKVVNASLASADSMEVNRTFHRMLVEGVDAEYRREDGTVAGVKVRLADSADGSKNDFLAVNQFTVVEDGKNRRMDIVLFVNGLPLVIFELKNPADEKADLQKAFYQIQTYRAEIPSVFAYNAFCVIGDGIVETRLGTFAADMDRYMKWRTMDGDTVAPGSVPQMEVLVKGACAKERLLDLIRNFIVFESDGAAVVKKIAAYHQYHATNKAVARTLEAAAEEGDRRCGVVWHTQGSGKSLTMVFYAGKIIQALENPTVVVLTDRNDLDDQLFGVFSHCAELLRQTPVQARDRGHLKELLKVASGGIVFTTIQKFFPEEKGSKHDLLSDRRNIIVIADEAHRSQYDFIDGFARHMHDALPNASFIGFTGTPIELSDKNTRAVFGEYVDVYDIVRAKDDHATVPIYYEPRLAKIDLLESEKPKIDEDFEELTEGEEVAKKEKLKSRWARLEAMVGSEKRIRQVAKDVVEQFEARNSVLEGKAMFVAMSRRIAVDLYEEIRKLRPAWHDPDLSKGAMKVVMTGSASDPPEFRPHVHTKQERERLAKRMKDPKDPLRFVIVRDMWLTGFDVPSMHSMYLDKPMRGHGLMQAIARTNRVYKDKDGGLIIDYIGVLPALKEAVKCYTENGSESPIIPIEEAISAMTEKYEVVRGIFHGFDASGAMSSKASERMRTVSAAMEFVLGLENGKSRYYAAVAELSAAFALATPSDASEVIREEVAFFQAVRNAIAKFDRTGGEGGPSEAEYDHALKQIVSEAIISNDVIDIFGAAGIANREIPVLSDTFLDELRGLKQKHVALELLKKLLNDEIGAMRKTYLVKSRSFSEMLEETIRRYQNQTIEAAQVMAELIDLAKHIRSEQERDAKLNLTPDEIAFYDALSANESAVAELGDDALKAIAQELVVVLRKNTSIDWTLKESVRAKLRVYVKKLLNKHHYPPDKQDAATRTVLDQAEVLCKDWTG